MRRSQAVTTWGPGALLDLPRYAVIVGGLDTWPKVSDLEEVVEPRLARKLEIMTGVKAPRLYAPPVSSDDPREPTLGIVVWRFPEWFVVQEEGGGGKRERSRRLVHRKHLDERSRFDGRQVVPTRFVRACTNRPRRRHRLATLRPRRRGQLPAPAVARRAGHQRRPR